MTELNEKIKVVCNKCSQSHKIRECWFVPGGIHKDCGGLFVKEGE